MKRDRKVAILCHLFFGLFAFCGVANASGGNSVAMVTDLQGRVTLAASSGGPGLSILSELKQDARLRLEGGAHVTVVYLDSGQEYQLSGPAEVQFGVGKPQSISGTAPSKRGAALTRSRETIRIHPVQVTQGALVMRAIDPDRKLRMTSLSDTTTLEPRPLFQWQSPEQGLQYEIVLLDDTGKALFDISASESPARLPDGVSLQPGIDYTWVVSAEGADEKSYTSAGDFKLASTELRLQVERLRPAVDAPLSERIVFATWLEQMNLRDEARKFWKTIAADHKDDERLKVLAGE